MIHFVYKHTVYIYCIFSYFLSYSEAAVLAFSVTPGYFNPPHFWIWTGQVLWWAGEFWLFSLFSKYVKMEILAALSHCFLEIHFWEVNIFNLLLRTFGSNIVFFFFRLQLIFSPWCWSASWSNHYGGLSRWWPSFSSSIQVINCVASQHDLWSIFTSTQAMIILWPILTAHHRRCCPLCDFLLPPLHDHRKCRSLISGPKASVKSKNNEFLTLIA